jgi:hypothetical protein
MSKLRRNHLTRPFGFFSIATNAIRVRRLHFCATLVRDDHRSKRSAHGRLIRNGCLGIDELDIDPHAVSAALHAAFEDIASAASGRIQ